MYSETILKAIEHAVLVLKEGGIILYPADTIWGIGCDAQNQQTIHRIYEIKGRKDDKPIIVLVSSREQLYEVASSVHPRIDTLLHFHERPLTVIYPRAARPFKHLAAPDGSIAVRLVKSGFCHELISYYDKPIVSTSANLSGEPSPTKFGTISSQIIGKVDYVLPASTERDITGTPSAIARYDENGELDFLR
jgi:L-threonylcarbamoyladenylate synthase